MYFLLTLRDAYPFFPHHRAFRPLRGCADAREIAFDASILHFSVLDMCYQAMYRENDA
jgi:hypothetical protein